MAKVGGGMVLLSSSAIVLLKHFFSGLEAEAAAELAFSRLRETRCLWDGCGVVLNSMKTLQAHIVTHADEGGEWVGDLRTDYFCRG